jgi:hypothetical protein
MVIDALMELLAVEPEGAADADCEHVRLNVLPTAAVPARTADVHRAAYRGRARTWPTCGLGASFLGGNDE